MKVLLSLLSGITVVSFVAGAAGNWYFLAGVPFLFLLAYVTIADFRAVFFLLFALIPFSTEVGLPGGFNTDLPTEPLMIGLMLVYLLYMIRHGDELRASFTKHAFTLLILIHLAWILVTALTSGDVLVSVKFLLAKGWYVLTFYFLAGHVIRSERQMKILFWVILFPLILTVLYVLARQAGQGFAFKMVDKAVRPFYRNHVNYACLLALFSPLLWYARSWYRRFSLKWWVIAGSTLIVLLGIQFSYTRAAYAAIMLAIVAWFVIRFKLIRAAIGLSVGVFLLGITYLASHNNYLYYAPTYEKTIRYVSFDNLIAATFQGKDISTMERVYRWIAGAYMTQDKPVFGFGPGTFTEFYKSYTVNDFQTYVSDNPEKSGIHCYYLMVFVEQGLPGFLIFLALVFYFLIKGEQIYHQTRDPQRRGFIMVLLLTFVIIDALLLINDMIETDKVGPFFFLCIAVLVNFDLANQKELASARSSGSSLV
ncbi:MAG: O-antigen ligase family protein [Bacteroidetes bacterium]|nr:MAG: O-antigen ligase family protein [Bacteroidota bacterium]